MADLLLSLKYVRCNLKIFTKTHSFQETKEWGLEKLVDFLSKHIVNQKYTTVIKSYFSSILIVIVTQRFKLYTKASDEVAHQEECICLSKLIDHSIHISK